LVVVVAKRLTMKGLRQHAIDVCALGVSLDDDTDDKTWIPLLPEFVRLDSVRVDDIEITRGDPLAGHGPASALNSHATGAARSAKVWVNQ
jgi:hypothetical protein